MKAGKKGKPDLLFWAHTYISSEVVKLLLQCGETSVGLSQSNSIHHQSVPVFASARAFSLLS